jgi:hypothetical protein
MSDADSYARILRLTQVAKQASQQILCVPIFTKLTDESSFAHFHELRARALQWQALIPNFSFLAYTGEGQPGDYDWHGEKQAVASFEGGANGCFGNTAGRKRIIILSARIRISPSCLVLDLSRSSRAAAARGCLRAVSRRRRSTGPCVPQ